MQRKTSNAKVISAILLSILMMVMVFPIAALSANITYEEVWEITSGEQYTFAMNGITPTGMENSQYALKSSAPDAGPENILDFVEFLGADDESDKAIVWVIEKFNNGYSIKAAGLSGENVYINIEPNSDDAADIKLGAVQELTIEESGSKFVISRTVNDIQYLLRFTNSNGSGFYGGTKTSSSEFILFKVAYAQPAPPPQEETSAPVEAETSAPVEADASAPEPAAVIMPEPAQVTLPSNPKTGNSLVVLAGGGLLGFIGMVIAGNKKSKI